MEGNRDTFEGFCVKGFLLINMIHVGTVARNLFCEPGWFAVLALHLLFDKFTNMYHLLCFSRFGKTQKTWTITIVYVLRGIGKHLTRYIRVKAHAISVSIRTFYSCVFFLFFAEIRRTRSKRTLLSICL